ncbi:MAG: plastocyanin/azurin family copper-binding protein, partial [Dehalococcoidia bacterium]
MTVRPRIIALIIALAGFGLLGLAATPSQAQETATVAVGDFYFCSESFEGGECVTTIEAGDTVLWEFSGAASTHTTTGDGWDSGNISGGTFSFTFDEEGEFAYVCNIHPSLMTGRIAVEAGPDTPVDSDD